MTKGVITLSHKELDRVSIIEQTINRVLTQTEAGRRLGISTRQVKRLVKRWREGGAEALASKHRGRVPNNKIKAEVKDHAIGLIRQHYHDFGPTFAHEKLVERHGFSHSVETLRQWMMSEGIWERKAQRAARVHQRRERRSTEGELVQIDGSPHDWFEGRAAACTLIVYIDDATGKLKAMRFFAAETTQAYMETTAVYLADHGRPVAFYSDRHGIFRVNTPGKEGELTQFTRALRTLDIEAIHAHTPQAKGRVERANGTLQDRLVKEMRLQNICSMEQANAFLPAFMADYNRRFAKPARDANNTHRPVLHNEAELALILSVHATRKLSKNLTLQFKNREYQLQGYGNGYRLRGAAVTVCEGFDGAVTLLHGGRVLAYRVLASGEAPVPLADEKSVHEVVDKARKKQLGRPRYKPPVDHPWRRSPIGRAARV